ncbi:nucleotidyltransferase domain-containing protein [Candidatus Pacearchaeota archaeon]|nr:nucleotidyltransferase domain-containing protein [Candidatus Pacearchaeota archaeon]
MNNKNSKNSSSKQQDSSGIPGMDLNNNYSAKKSVIPQDSGKIQKELDKKKKELDKLKNFITKKYKFTQAIGILPPQGLKEFIEEETGEDIERIPKEHIEKLQTKNHVYIIIPEDEFKNIKEIKKQIVEFADKEKINIWLYIKTPIDIWETCFDSKFEMVDAIAMSYPLYDTGILESLRVASIHKSLVLQKFDKYVVSYVIAGSLVRGDATKTSDVDVFIIINDTDVRRMPRLELKERLRSMIYQYVGEAEALAGVKGKLSPQIYLLTEFWESVKDANPLMFTFIRDGVPIYDKGTFMPWKALLKMGKLKPSPESIDMFMSMGDTAVKRGKKALMDILIHDIYWSVLTPAQAMFMLNGLPPPTHKEVLQGAFRKNFVEKEKMIEKKYADILEEIVGLYKDYEHERLKEVKGAKIDKLLKNTEDYLKRLRELREQIEKRYQERTIEQNYEEMIRLLKIITGKKSLAAIKEEFKKFVKQGKFTKQDYSAFEKVIKARGDFKKGKSNTQKIDSARKDASTLINNLIDYSQRCELVSLEKGRFKIRFKKSGKEIINEILLCSDCGFLFDKNSVRKIDSSGSIKNSDMKEVTKIIEEQKKKSDLKINPEIFSVLRKELGEFEIIL